MRAIATMAALHLAACATIEHTKRIEDVTARSLRVASPEGRNRLEIERAYDPAIRDLIAQRGLPTWLHVVDRNEVLFYYTADDAVAVVTRPMVPPGNVRVYERSPGFLLNLLPKPVVSSVLAVRKKQDAKHARAPKPKRRVRRAVSPASIGSRDATKLLHDFNPDRIIARLRSPMSAADPGIQAWKVGKAPGGATIQFANSGTTRFVVQKAAVSVRASIAPRGRSAPNRARRAFRRINQAVFGTHAGSVDRRLAETISRVAADTSGRTRYSNHVAGRLVSVTRNPSQGVLIYSVHAQ